MGDPPTGISFECIDRMFRIRVIGLPASDDMQMIWHKAVDTNQAFRLGHSIIQ